MSYCTRGEVSTEAKEAGRFLDGTALPALKDRHFFQLHLSFNRFETPSSNTEQIATI
jgi:hypothetical protein